MLSALQLIYFPFSAHSLGGRHHRRILSRTEDEGPRNSSADASSKQSSSHLSVTSLYSSSNDCDEDPIMV